jgi:hypothetical protein
VYLATLLLSLVPHRCLVSYRSFQPYWDLSFIADNICGCLNPPSQASRRERKKGKEKFKSQVNVVADMRAHILILNEIIPIIMDYLPITL